MIKLMFRFINGVGAFIALDNITDITLRVSRRPLLSVGSGKQSACQKLGFFAWLLLADRLNTKDLLRRRHKHLDEGYHCVLCHEQVDETSLHLFF
jgi:hypothetical protein